MLWTGCGRRRDNGGCGWLKLAHGLSKQPRPGRDQASHQLCDSHATVAGEAVEQLVAASPSWARAAPGLASQPPGPASPAWASASRALGAAAMAASAAPSSSSVRKKKEDNPVFHAGPRQAQEIGPVCFSEIPFLKLVFF